MRFKILSEIRVVETIASGRGVRDRRRLNREHGRGNWRKLKGIATIELLDGTILEAEIHWYEAHGIGKKEIKFKGPVGKAQSASARKETQVGEQAASDRPSEGIRRVCSQRGLPGVT